MKKIVLVLSLGLFLTGCEKAPSKIKDETKESSVTQVSSTSETSTPKEETKEMEVFEAGSLIQAVMNNDIEFTKRILEDKTYNINEVNQQNESALLIATHNNFVEIAKVLIDHGADVNQQDNIQDSPYLYAGAQGKTEILAYMLKNSQPNQQIYNRFGGNTIIPAAEKGHLDTVKLLLEDGTVDINHQNNYGYTALIEAIALTDGSKVYQDIVAELLKYGADKNLKDNYGKTATDYARELGYGNILKMLENQ
ncbi:ankyrin repeat domain-containing protein [Vagococcus fluvialis]|uniref:ankyrin repeat domain-containing protein n=1 Tax=Vagococcus fluvialis TaxID=2738 RepID=UPI003B5CE2C0